MKLSASFESNLSAKLLDLPNATSFKVRTEALMAGAEPMRAEAERNAPRRSGRLASHIIKDAYTASEVAAGEGVDFNGNEAVVAIGPDADHFYGYFREFGTVKEPARPWFRPAVDSTSGIALNIVLGKLWDAIRNFAGKSSSGGNVGSRNL